MRVGAFRVALSNCAPIDRSDRSRAGARGVAQEIASGATQLAPELLEHTRRWAPEDRRVPVPMFQNQAPIFRIFHEKLRKVRASGEVVVPGDHPGAVATPAMMVA